MFAEYLGHDLNGIGHYTANCETCGHHMAWINDGDSWFPWVSDSFGLFCTAACQDEER